MTKIAPDSPDSQPFTPFAGDQTEDNDEWYTPPHIIEFVRFVLGGIALDTASSREANTVVKAHRFFTIEDDALSHRWHDFGPGGVFCNPPYSGGYNLSSAFWFKMRSEFDSGHFGSGIFLANAKTETRWFQDALTAGFAVLLPRSRLSFWREGRGSRTGYFGSALALLSRRLYRDGTPTSYIDDPLARFMSSPDLGRVIVSVA